MRIGWTMRFPELEMESAEKLPGFSCRRCGRCCRGKLIVIYAKDMARLKGLGGCFEETTLKERALTGAAHKMKMPQGRCVFLKDDLCTNYERRPDTCRRHPFLVTKKSILVATTCPGVDWSGEGRGGELIELSAGIAPSLERYLSRQRE